MEIPSAPTLATALRQQLSAARASEAQPNSAAKIGQSIDALIVAVKMDSAPQTGQLPRSNPPAYTITLRVGNEQLEVSSERPLMPGQHIQIKPLTMQRLLVLNPPAESPELRTLLAQQHLMQQGLRQALPMQQAYAVAIGQMAVLLQNPLASQYRPIHHYFRQLLQALPRPQQLQTSAGIKQAIQNSGVFLEHKLNSSPAAIKLLSTANASAQPANNSAVDSGSGMANRTAIVIPGSSGIASPSTGQTAAQETAASLLSQAGQPAALPQSPTEKTQAPTQNQRIEPLSSAITDKTTANTQHPQPLSETVRSDFKAQLLQMAGLLKALQSSSPFKPDNTRSNLLGSQLSANRDPLVSDALYTARGKLAHSGDMANSALSSDSSTTADTPEHKILLQLQSSLARLQLQQLNTLELQHGGQHETAAKTSFHLEIPVLTSSGHLDTLFLQVEEELSGQPTQDTSPKERVWKITLSFDMEHLGLFHAQLKLIQESVAATFWAERQETVTAIKQEFAELERGLESAGIHVTQLQCHQGQPAQTSNRLQQSLIDLKT